MKDFSGFESQEFESRKRDHLRFSLDARTEAMGQTGFDAVHLIHQALPEIDFSEVTFDGKPPFFVSGMTAGHADAPLVNQVLARACEARGWAMGLGSMRRDLDDPASVLDNWASFRDRFPTLYLFGNIGISQLIGVPVTTIRRLVQVAGLNAFAVHLNPLQEVMQPEGTPQFRGGIAALERLVGELGIPVILKETGCGFSVDTLSRIRHIPFSAIDVSGLGGTHWGRIEGLRAAESHHQIQSTAARTFANWGVSTVESIRNAARVLSPKVEIWATGGIRTGLDAAKAISLGATRVGYARPALEHALVSDVSLLTWMETQEFELRSALFLSGCRTPRELAQAFATRPQEV